MIKSYPDKNSLKEVMINWISIRPLKEFCKERGIIIPTNRSVVVGEYAHLIFWGYDDIQKLSELMDDKNNYKKSAQMVVNVDNINSENNTPIKVITTTVENMQSKVLEKDGLEIKKIQNLNDSGTKKEIILEYSKVKKGMVDLLAKEKKVITVELEEKGNDVIFNVIHEDSVDLNKVQKFIETIKSETTEAEIKENHVTLDNLTVSERINLFDNFFKYNFDNWIFDGLKSLKVKKNKAEVDEIEENGNNEDEIVKNDVLAGINSALLKGNGLRTNKFVIDCINGGFYFTGAEVKLNHKIDAISIVIVISFNENSGILEIKISESYDIIDGKESKRVLFESEQKKYLSYFNDVMREIYNNILLERSNNK